MTDINTDIINWKESKSEEHTILDIEQAKDAKNLNQM